MEYEPVTRPPSGRRRDEALADYLGNLASDSACATVGVSTASLPDTTDDLQP